MKEGKLEVPAKKSEYRIEQVIGRDNGGPDILIIGTPRGKIRVDLNQYNFAAQEMELREAKK